MDPTFVKLGLPRFKFEFSSILDQLLKDLGMRQAFKMHNISADFSGLAKPTDAQAYPFPTLSNGLLTTVLVSGILASAQ